MSAQTLGIVSSVAGPDLGCKGGGGGVDPPHRSHPSLEAELGRDANNATLLLATVSAATIYNFFPPHSRAGKHGVLPHSNK